MSRDFGVENLEYKDALSKIRMIKLPASHWEQVSILLSKVSDAAEQLAKSQIVDDELLHKRFTL